MQAEDAATTQVTWGFDTDMGTNPLARYMGLMMDRWVGGEYEAGLQNLKRVAELEASKPAPDTEPDPAASTETAQDLAAADGALPPALDMTVLTMASQPFLYVPGETSQNPDDIAEGLAAAYGAVEDVLAREGIAATGSPMALAKAWADGRYVFWAGMPIAPGVEPDLAGGPVVLGETPGGKVVRVVHKGPYEMLTATYDAAEAAMAAQNMWYLGDSWEEYINDPSDTPEAELLTHIYFPVK